MFNLFIISFLSLYFEILFIRWLPGEIHLLGFFKNLVLLSAFTGLGVGCMKKEKKASGRDTLALWPFFLLPLLLLQYYGKERLKEMGFSGTAINFFHWMDPPKASGATQTLRVLGFMVVLYLYVCAMFFMIGRKLGASFEGIPSLRAYTVNLTGSLMGLLSFTLLSSFSTPPVIWFLSGFFLLVFLFRGKLMSFCVCLSGSVLCLLFMFFTKENAVWSPYYKINIFPVTASSEISGETGRISGYDIMVNGHWHQYTLDFSPLSFTSGARAVGKDYMESAIKHYMLPYAFGYRKKVLVLGSGTGNDVQAALLRGAESVDAVEIDPVIINLGRQYHPNAPYASNIVQIINNDARSYLSATRNTYDLVTFGFLDSHSVFSQLSSLRLDNFVYTVEGIRAAKDRLAPGGILALTFSVGQPWIGKRFESMLTEVFGKLPVVYRTPWGLTTYLSGEGIAQREEKETASKKGSTGAVLPATDDWPHLYLKEKSLPAVYGVLLVLMFVCSVGFAAAVYLLSPNTPLLAARDEGAVEITSAELTPCKEVSQIPRSLLRGRLHSGTLKPQLHFFFLGCAFMLIETKSIAQMALLFGSTWTVNVIAIALVLIVAIGANLLAQKISVSSKNPYYAGIMGGLVIQYIFPFHVFLGAGLLLKIIVSTFVFFVPVFFAGFVFSSSFKESQDVQKAFGSNLLGAVAGGLVEYASLVVGIQAMALVALCFYVFSWVSLRKA